MGFFHFMGQGGWAMWFVLGLGLCALAAAASFALRPDSRRGEVVRSFSLATLFSSVATVSLDLAAVGSKVPANPEWANSPRLHLIVMEGIAESLAPAILGFTLLSFVWIVMAVGQRRLTRELPLG